LIKTNRMTAIKGMIAITEKAAAMPVINRLP